MTFITKIPKGVWIMFSGLILGLGIMFGFTVGCQKKPVTETKIIEKTIEVEKQLTDIHVLRDVCSVEFIVAQKRGNGLCRLLWCRANTRNALGTAQSATSKECEAVSNMINKQSIIELCQSFSKDETTESEERQKKFDKCIGIFDRRI